MTAPDRPTNARARTSISPSFASAYRSPFDVRSDRAHAPPTVGRRTSASHHCADVHSRPGWLTATASAIVSR
ncbi:hypothetical protein [Kitasatospora sp. NPDC058046]|uniref:hypothetical protein n=1 Tax=Kitasatospora sp. NPDC058046 TaxID=3346312 RepID=UPI0036DA9E15